MEAPEEEKPAFMKRSKYKMAEQDLYRIDEIMRGVSNSMLHAAENPMEGMREAIFWLNEFYRPMRPWVIDNKAAFDKMEGFDSNFDKRFADLLQKIENEVNRLNSPGPKIRPAFGVGLYGELNQLDNDLHTVRHVLGMDFPSEYHLSTEERIKRATR